MKILLVAVNAKYIHSNLAVYSLRAYAKAYARHIELAEYTINHRADDILRDIYLRSPDVLCFSCYIWNISCVEEVAREFHKLRPDVPIWLGGPEVSFETGSFLKSRPWVAGVMVGEGEQTFLELCKWYVEQAGGGFPDNVRGIAYRRMPDGEVFIAPPQDAVDLSGIPFCYEDMEAFENRIIYYESSRGCPFSCSYCLSSVDKTLRFRDLALVKKELSFFIAHNVPQVKFVDRTFNCKKEHAMEIWRFIMAHDKGVTNFHFEIAADLLDKEELELLASMRPGLVQLEIGVQSTYPPTIREIRRAMRLERVKEAVSDIKRGGNIHQHLDLIAGLPYEDYRTFQKSFDEIYALRPEQLQLGFLKVLKGSYMYGQTEAYGLVFHEKPPYEVLYTRWISYGELLQVRLVEEMLEVYYNSGQFPATAAVLENAFRSAFAMFLALGRFYEERGYLALKHTRLRRAEILLEFAERADAGHIPLYRESLTFDLYLRENLKSRPAWAPDPREWKTLTRTYCKNGRLSHIEPFHYDFCPYAAGRQCAGYPQKTERCFVQFDYEERDRLSNAAKVSRCSGDFLQDLRKAGDKKI